MKKLLVLSGKGGTGKTTVAAGLIDIGHIMAFADCDVDAPNLHIVTSVESESDKRPYYGMEIAYIDQEKCTQCGLCSTLCRFDAVDANRINTSMCEGCGLCERLCPSEAIQMLPYQAGDCYLYDGERSFVTAQLKMGSGTTGKLVTEVKNYLNSIGGNKPVAIIDGSPGIGCPVIASLAGVDKVLIVTEPSVSGLHDMKRIVNMAIRSKVPISVCINKYDVNKELTKQILSYCKKNALEVAGLIPYDKDVLKAVNSAMPVTSVSSKAGDAIRHLYKSVVRPMFYEGVNNDNKSLM